MIDSPALLYLGGENEIRLFELGRFAQVCSQLPRPESQRPRIVQFVGGRQRASIVKHFFPFNNLSRKRHPCLASLRADNSTINHETPLFFIESDLHASSFVDLPSLDRDRSNVLPLSWLRGRDLSSSNDIVHCRLLFLFADVVCVFLDDFPTLEDFVQRFHEWLEIESASLLPGPLRPRVLFVTAEPERASVADSLCHIYQNSGKQNFSSVQVIRLESDSLGSTSRVLRLKDTVLTHSAQMFALREENYVLFTATHLQALFGAAAVHCSTTLQDPFDCLTAARRISNLRDDFTPHLGRFVALAQRYYVPYHDVVALVASALALNAYPPGMHSKDP
jgi:hypothetical protein